MGKFNAGTPPPAPAVRKDVIRVTTSECQTLVCLSSSVWGQGVHWGGGRTHECLKERKLDCDGCKRGLPWKWKGYLHVADGQGWDGFLELTPTAWAMLESHLDPQKPLRGVMFRIRRTKGGAKGRYIIDVLERRFEEHELLDAKDPYSTLRFLWSCKRSSGQSAA